MADGINWSDLSEEAKQGLWKVRYEIFITIKSFPFDFRRMHEPHLALMQTIEKKVFEKLGIRTLYVESLLYYLENYVNRVLGLFSVLIEWRIFL